MKRYLIVLVLISFTFSALADHYVDKRNLYSKFLISYFALKRYDLDYIDQFQDKNNYNDNSLQLSEYIFFTKLLSGGIEKITKFYSLEEIEQAGDTSLMLGEVISLIYYLKNDELGKVKELTANNSYPTDNELGSLIIPFMRAWQLVYEKKTSEAINLLNSMVEPDTYDPFVSLQLAQIYENIDDKEQANLHYSIVTHEDNASLTELGSLLASRFYIKQGKVEKALEIYSPYKEIYSYDQWLSLIKVFNKDSLKRKISFILLEIGEIMKNMDYNYSYIAYNNSASYLDPELDYSNLKLAKFYQTLNKHDSAIKLYQSINKYSPLSEIAKLELGKY